MEVQLTPDVEKKLNDLAAESGRGTNELLQDALAGYLDEMAQTYDALNSRYDDLKSGRVKPISRDEVAAHFREKSAAARQTSPGS
jgi:predicted DNA-binding protein